MVKAALSGGADYGGPFIHHARCTRDGCPQAWVPVRASAREPFGWPELAAAIAPAAAVWFVLAMPGGSEEPGRATYRIAFIRCAEVGCARPQRHPGGTVRRTPDDWTGGTSRAQLRIDADGRPEDRVLLVSAVPAP